MKPRFSIVCDIREVSLVWDLPDRRLEFPFTRLPLHPNIEAWLAHSVATTIVLVVLIPLQAQIPYASCGICRFTQDSLLLLDAV